SSRRHPACRSFLDVAANWVIVTPGTRIEAVHNVARPTFRDIFLRGGNLVVGGAGGRPNGLLQLLSTTNLASSLTNWIPAATNYFDASGNFLFTNPPAPGDIQRFYIL
ncbi:MAG: hypothetical protein ACKOET_00025, partial [Verrucomicrobiota bacterium]